MMFISPMQDARRHGGGTSETDALGRDMTGAEIMRS
jgi:hypothetical protein